MAFGAGPPNLHSPHSRIPAQHILGRTHSCGSGESKRVVAELSISASTMSRHLWLLKLGRMRDVELRPTIICYGHETLVEIIHMDIRVDARPNRP